MQDLRDLLRADDTGGKHILEGYLKSYKLFEEAEENGEEVAEPMLSESQRTKLVELIVKFLLGITKYPDHTNFPIITKKIVNLFKSETEVSGITCSKF